MYCSVRFLARFCFPEAKVTSHLNLCTKDTALKLTSEASSVAFAGSP